MIWERSWNVIDNKQLILNSGNVIENTQVMVGAGVAGAGYHKQRPLLSGLRERWNGAKAMLLLCSLHPGREQSPDNPGSPSRLVRGFIVMYLPVVTADSCPAIVRLDCESKGPGEMGRGRGCNHLS